MSKPGMIEAARTTIKTRVGAPQPRILLGFFLDMLRDKKFTLVGAIPGEEESFYDPASATQFDFIFAFQAFRHECKCCTYYWTASIEMSDAEPTLDFEVMERLSRFVNRRKSYLPVADQIDIDEIEELPTGLIHGAWVVMRQPTGGPTTRLLVLRGMDHKIGLSMLNNAVYDHFFE